MHAPRCNKLLLALYLFFTCTGAITISSPRFACDWRNTMTTASHSVADVSIRYVSMTDAVYENRTTYSVISRLIKDGKIAVHLVAARIMLDGDEAAREIVKFKNRSVLLQAVQPSLV